MRKPYNKIENLYNTWGNLHNIIIKLMQHRTETLRKTHNNTQTRLQNLEKFMRTDTTQYNTTDNKINRTTTLNTIQNIEQTIQIHMNNNTATTDTLENQAKIAKAIHNIKKQIKPLDNNTTTHGNIGQLVQQN